MSVAAIRYDYTLQMNASLKIPLVFSLLFHISVMAFAYYGMPYIKPESAIIENVTVDIVSEGEISDKPIEKRPAIPPKNEAPAPPSRPTPPKMTEEMPKLAAPKPPALVEDLSKPVTPAIPPPKPEDIKRKPTKPPAPSPASQEEKEPQENKETFNTLLRNLTPHAPDNPQQQAPLTSPESGKSSPLSRFARQVVSSGEMNALRSQLAACWNIPAGAKYAENLVVEVRIFVNPDRTVNSAHVLNPNNRDPFFRTAAESAIRAVYSPQCNPLNLPPSKYDQWKTIVVRFDPREMLQ